MQTASWSLTTLPHPGHWRRSSSLVPAVADRGQQPEERDAGRDQEPDEERTALDPPDDAPGQAEEEQDHEQAQALHDSASALEERLDRPEDGDDRGDDDHDPEHRDDQADDEVDRERRDGDQDQCRDCPLEDRGPRSGLLRARFSYCYSVARQRPGPVGRGPPAGAWDRLGARRSTRAAGGRCGGPIVGAAARASRKRRTGARLSLGGV